MTLPSVAERLLRPRLVALLRERFDRRLTIVVAPAGFGKTTALVQAIHENQTEPLGRDVWAVVREADGVAELYGQLEAGVLGPDSAAHGTASTLDDVLAAVLARAPEDIVLCVDDLHFGSAEVVAAVRSLIERLPANGHVVVASRTPVPVASARLISSGAVLQIDATTLSFSDSEVKSICKAHGAADVNALGAEASWPAQLALALRSDRTTQARYLAEEVLEALDPDRRRALAELAILGSADDTLAARVTGGAIRAVEPIVAGLPLVDRFADGTVRLHDLWVDALRPHIADDRRNEILRKAAQVLQGDGRYVAALEMSFAAGDFESMRSAAIAEAARPATQMSLANVRRCVDLLGYTDFRALEQYFQALEQWSVRGAFGVGERFVDIATLAGSEGDHTFEALMLYRALQTHGDSGGKYTERVFELVDRLPDLPDKQIAMTRWMVEWGSALHVADVPRLLELLDELQPIAGAMTPHFQAMYLTDLGRPELVTGDVFRDDFGVTRELAPAIELFVAQATWLRGDVSPELALELGADLALRTSRRGMQGQVVPQLAVFAIVAAGAGDGDYIARTTEALDRVDPAALGANVQSFPCIARGVIAASIGDDDQARQMFARAADLSPPLPWPYRSWMYALVPLYVLMPDLRPGLDSLDLGTSLRAALDVARVIVGVRESGDIAGVEDLPWDRPELLRVHVPVAMLVEACVAGSVSGCVGASELLDQLPNPGAALLRCAETAQHGAVKRQARSLAQGFPSQPVDSVEVRFLGPIELRRNGRVVDHPDWRRSRVQELLAFLLLNPTITRAAAATTIWPDHDEDAAQNNLRVHLSYLSKVLEPDRKRGAPTWFVRSRGDVLALHAAGIESDIAGLITASDDAGRADRDGVPSEAIRLHRLVVALYRGDLLQGSSASWVDFDRLDLRSRAVASLVRLGELALATGEPEQARDLARNALDVERYDERAVQLLVRALRGTGDEVAAHAAATAFRARAHDLGISVSAETERIFNR